MQTFLPYPDFYKCASSLDKKRCWKQAVEAKQILCTLRAKNLPESWINSKSYKKQKWINHPAVQMWKDYEYYLIDYYNTFLSYSIYVHKVKTTKLQFLQNSNQIIIPWWMCNEQLHRSHRAKLLEKNYQYYIEKFSFGDYKFNNGNYFWPVNESQTFKVILKKKKHE